MIITLSGITGCGKSYYKQLLVNKMNINNMVIYTTRKKRVAEIDGLDKNFIDNKTFEKLVNNQELFASYDFLGEKYGYGKEYLEENIHSVTELHYEWINDFKKKAKNVLAIYIVPKSIEKAKKELKKRNLSPEVEKQRLKEIDNHVKNIKNNEELKKQFDIIFYNDYTEESDKKMLEIIEQNILKRKKLFL